MLPIETQLQQAGLEAIGYCTGLSRHSPHWRHDAVLLEDLTDAEADALGALMPMARAQPGQVMIREGDVGDWMLLILSGTVDVTKKTETDETSRLAVVKEGAAIGEMSMFDAAPRYATCTAIEQVEAGLLTRATIAKLIQDHPKVAAKLLVKLTQLLAQRLRNTSNQLVKLLQGK
jgi:CRP/FNR family transcriptional regulator, cyclic AMP receptor protein